MSWSRGFSGTAAEVIEQFKAQREAIEAGLPEYEKADVQIVVEAAEALADGVPTGAKVQLSVSGHGWRNTAPQPGDSVGAGAMSASINYTLPAPA